MVRFLGAGVFWMKAAAIFLYRRSAPGFSLRAWIRLSTVDRDVMVMGFEIVWV